MFFELPQYSFIENGASSKLKEILLKLKIQKPLVITDDNLVKYCSDFGDIIFNKDISLSQVKINFTKYDGIIGFGGGSVLDKARYLAFKLKIPFISFASSLSTDAIASSIIPSSITSSNKGDPIIKCPDVVIIDLDIIDSSLKRLSIAGYGDLMAKIPANLDWKLANIEKNETYDKEISDLAKGSAHFMLDYVLKNDFHLSSFNKQLSKALVLCGMLTSLTRNSRPISGAEHIFLKTLILNKEKQKGQIDALHGEIVGVSTLLFTYLHEIENKEIKGITDKLKLSYKKIGHPTSFKKIGINFDFVLKALLTAHNFRNRWTILRNGIDKNLATKVLKKIY